MSGLVQDGANHLRTTQAKHQQEQQPQQNWVCGAVRCGLDWSCLVDTAYGDGDGAEVNGQALFGWAQLAGMRGKWRQCKVESLPALDVCFRRSNVSTE